MHRITARHRQFLGLAPISVEIEHFIDAEKVAQRFVTEDVTILWQTDPLLLKSDQLSRLFDAVGFILPLESSLSPTELYREYVTSCLTS
jgi:hypothetical protein